MVSCELIAQAIKESGLEQIKTCCGVEHKYCNLDEWKGNLQGFANILIRLQQKETARSLHPSN